LDKASQSHTETLSCTTSPRAAILVSDEKTYAFLTVIESQWNNSEARLLFEPQEGKLEELVALIEPALSKCINS
jgi:hypothetical protein